MTTAPAGRPLDPRPTPTESLGTRRNGTTGNTTVRSRDDRRRRVEHDWTGAVGALIALIMLVLTMLLGIWLWAVAGVTAALVIVLAGGAALVLVARDQHQPRRARHRLHDRSAPPRTRRDSRRACPDRPRPAHPRRAAGITTTPIPSRRTTWPMPTFAAGSATSRCHGERRGGDLRSRDACDEQQPGAGVGQVVGR
jgi:hypothetical protein